MALGCMHSLEDVETIAGLRLDAVIVDEKLIKSPSTLERMRELLHYDDEDSSVF